MLAKKLPRYWSEIEPSIKVKVSDNEKIAYTSFAYNVGSAAFRKSSMVRKLNAGDHKGACNALLAYDMASGKHIKGLKRRRIAERNICLTPDGSKPVEQESIVTHSPKSALAVKPAPVCTGWWIFKRCH
jgi:lysozyme